MEIYQTEGKKLLISDAAVIVGKKYTVNPRDLYNVYKTAEKKYEIYSHFNHTLKIKGSLLATFVTSTNTLTFLA